MGKKEERERELIDNNVVTIGVVVSGDRRGHRGNKWCWGKIKKKNPIVSDGTNTCGN